MVYYVLNTNLKLFSIIVLKLLEQSNNMHAICHFFFIVRVPTRLMVDAFSQLAGLIPLQ